MIVWLREFWRSFHRSFIAAYSVSADAARRGADFETARKLGLRAADEAKKQQ